MPPGMHRAVFLDRDGVLNRSLVSNGRPLAPLHLSEFELLPDAVDATRALKLAGFKLIVFTNQPEVSKGSITLNTLNSMHSILMDRLPLDHIELCVHSDIDQCTCRKPMPGMIMSAATKLDIDIQRSFVVGDRWRDIEAGKTAGCLTIWVNRGYAEQKPKFPNWTVSSTLEAAQVILQHSVLGAMQD